MKVKVVSDTLFKLSPKLSNQLSQSEKVFVKNGTEFEVISYTEADGNHTRLVLANQTLGNNQRIWYAYNPDIEIESSPVKLRVISDTLFKGRPVLSSQLADDEKIFVKNKTEFDLQSYLPAAGNHVKVALANKFLGPQNRNTWYAYEPDVQISGSSIKLKVVSDTLFKLRPVLSSQLAAAEKIFVKNGTQFELTESQLAEGNHVRVVLANTGLGDRAYKEWYAYAPDIVVEGSQSSNAPPQGGGTAPQPVPTPTPTPPAANQPTGAFRLPGFSSTFYLSEPIVPNGNFTWAEATKYGSRIPADRNVTYGIIRVARVMEDVRARLGDRPISINSWYRDPSSNQAVGGALYSRHISGDAIDFVVTGLHSYTVYDSLNGWWGNQGGLASSSIFTHIDVRGYYARWSYGY